MRVKQLTVSVMPTFYCESRCEYCYLGSLRNNTAYLDIRMLNDRLLEIIKHGYFIERIEAYGGDITELPDNYVNGVVDKMLEFSDCLVYTGGLNQATKRFQNINLSVNKGRFDYENNLKTAKENDYNVIITALPNIIGYSARYILQQLNGIKGYVTFMPYSASAKNPLHSPFSYAKDQNGVWNFDNFLSRIVMEYVDYRSSYTFELSNLDIIKDALNGYYNPLMRNNIFIMPSGNFACVQYKNGLEYFKELNSIEEWEEECKKDELLYQKNCAHCEYYMNGCIADHVRDGFCNGCPQTVTWVKEFA